VYLVFAQILKI